jgi:hypothetical protein
MEQNLGPSGLNVSESLRGDQYPQGNDLPETTAQPVAGGDTVGGHPQGGPTEEGHANQSSLAAEPTGRPLYTLKQLSESSHFMAPNHQPSDRAVDGCSCRDCRYYRLDELSVGAWFKSLEAVEQLYRDKKIDSAGRAMAIRTISWWVPY